MSEQARCPRCDAHGEVGEQCQQANCDGTFHYIPADAHAKLAESEFRDPLIGRRIDDYLPIRILGRGSYGKVYLTLQLPLLMETAMKLLFSDSVDDDAREAIYAKFRAEALSLARLTHPNIVRLIKYGQASNRLPYMVMEYVGGGRTLAVEMRRSTLLAQTDALRILDQLLGGLQCAHENHVVHRDIKPDNIMLQRISGDPYFVRIVDFGIAKFTENQRNTQHLIGTPIYMAPEQVTMINIGPWTDLYAVAMIALELLSGQRPFIGADSQQLLLKKLDPSFDPMAEVKLPEEFEKVLRKGLSREVAGRYQSANEFRLALKAMVAVNTGSTLPVTGLAMPKARATPAEPDASTEILQPKVSSARSRRWLWISLVAVFIVGGASLAYFLSVNTKEDRRKSVSLQQIKDYLSSDVVPEKKQAVTPPRVLTDSPKPPAVVSTRCKLICGRYAGCFSKQTPTHNAILLTECRAACGAAERAGNQAVVNKWAALARSACAETAAVQLVLPTKGGQSATACKPICDRMLYCYGDNLPPATRIKIRKTCMTSCAHLLPSNNLKILIKANANICKSMGR